MSKETLARIFSLSAALLLGVTLLPGVRRGRASDATRAATSPVAVEASHAVSPDRRKTSGRPGDTAVEVLRAVTAPAHPSAAQQPPGDKPVEQTRKNIQVLKGLPESQLFTLMNFVAASLGVQCNYCHVRQGSEWVWESDDKPKKQVARRMMQMVLDVNKTNAADFRSNVVTCYTCHQGHTEPDSLPAMPLVKSAHEPNAEATAPSGTARVRPTVEQLVSNYVAAVGGRDAAAKLETRVFKGTVERSQGRTGPLEVTIKGADKYLSVATLPQGTVTQVLDGTGGWIKAPNQQRARNPSAPEQILRPLSPAEVAQLRSSARELFDVVRISAPTPGMKFAGMERIGERDAYVTEATTPEGKTERLYFDTQTGLLLRKTTLTPSVLFAVPEQIDYEDYRDVGGVKVPFTVRVSNIDTFYSATRKFTEIKHNVPVDDAIFRMPAAPAPAAPAATPQK